MKLAGLAAMTASCSFGASTLDAGDLVGIWVPQSFDVGGSLEQVETGVNTARPPWMEVNGSIDGVLGCNGFGIASFEVDGDELTLGESFTQLAACLDSDPDNNPMEAEEAFRSIIQAEIVTIAVSGSAMTWEADDVRLVFEPSDSRPSR